MKGWTIQPLGWLVLVIAVALTLIWTVRWLQSFPPRNQDQGGSG